MLLASGGVGIGVALLGLLGDRVDLFTLFIGFAPSCLLVFTLPEAPVSQPSAVVGGQLSSSLVGVLAGFVLPSEWWSAAIAAALAVLTMAVLRMLHPPAVANAVIACTTGAGWAFLLMPVLAASLLIVVVALIWHRVTRTSYPHIARLRP